MGMIRTGSNYILKGAMLLATVFIMVPFSPKMPTMHIDYSWAIALNQAVAQSLIFGKDIIFTLGPYASIYTKVYHPSTDWMMIAGSLYLAICYWLVCISLINSRNVLPGILFIISLLGLLYARDALFLSYPLLIGVWIVTHSKKEPSKLRYQITCATLYAPLGLLALIKGTFLIQIIFFISISTVFFFYTNKKKLAFISLMVPSLSCAIFWVAAHQPLSALPAFIITSNKLSMGFSEAMSNEGNYLDIYIFLIVSLIELLIVAVHNNYGKIERILLFSVLLLFLFISFKAGFTRHQGHAYVASTALLFSGLILSFVYPLKTKIALITLSMGSALFINSNYTQVALSQNIHATVSTAFHGINNRVSDAHWPNHNYQTLMHFIANQSKLPSLDGTSDIYSYDQVNLIASGNQWSPRPVFQSYSAFTADLAKANKAKLQQHPPTNIFFRMQPVDNKFPTLDDGPSWRIILSDYQPIEMKNGYLILRKRRNAPSQHTLNYVTVRQTHQLGETVQLPYHASIVFARLSINPTLFGKLLSVFYNPDQLSIQLELADGSSRSFRISANMAKAGFLLSPLIESTDALSQFMHNPRIAEKNKIKSFQINLLSPNSSHWQSQYSVSYEYKLAQ